jgi:hypothetical protein
VAQVVKAEGGTIVAENDPRGGARMTMRLPTVAGSAEVVSSTGATGATGDAGSDGTTGDAGSSGDLPLTGKAPEIGAAPGRPTDP